MNEFMSQLTEEQYTMYFNNINMLYYFG